MTILCTLGSSSIELRAFNKRLTDEERFELSQTVLETAMLPLHHSSKQDMCLERFELSTTRLKVVYSTN